MGPLQSQVVRDIQEFVETAHFALMHGAGGKNWRAIRAAAKTLRSELNRAPENKIKKRWQILQLLGRARASEPAAPQEHPLGPLFPHGASKSRSQSRRTPEVRAGVVPRGWQALHAVGNRGGSALRVQARWASHHWVHVLWHPVCSHLAMLGAAPRAIQELVGHSTLSMTLRYMHLAPSALREAIGLLDFGQPVGSDSIAMV